MSTVGNNLIQLLLTHSVGQPDSKVFATELTKSNHTDGATHLLSANDPFAIIKGDANHDQATVVFTDELTLLQGLPHLYDLRNLPIVVNVALQVGDYSVIAALKDLDIISLVSNDAQTAFNNTQLAINTTKESGKAVFNFINTRYISNVPSSIDANNGDADIESAPRFTIARESSDSATSAVINLSSYYKSFADNLPKNVALIDINIYRPWSIDQLLELIPKAVTRIVIVEGAIRETASESTTVFEPLLLDFFSDFNKLVERNIEQLVLTKVGRLPEESIGDSLDVILGNLNKQSPKQNLFVGKAYSQDEHRNKEYLDTLHSSVNKVHNLEDAYINILRNMFSSNLQILNDYNEKTIGASTPEFGFG